MEKKIELKKYALDMDKMLNDIVKIEKPNGYITIERNHARKHIKEIASK